MSRTIRISGLIAALALAAPPAVIAGEEGYGGDSRRWAQDAGVQQVRHGKFYRHSFGRWKGKRWHYPPARGWRPGWRQRWHPRWGYRPYRHGWRNNRSSFVTGALIGSALTRSDLHRRDDHRYCDHAPRRGAGTASCYRVERLPNGRERRVPLPDAACF